MYKFEFTENTHYTSIIASMRYNSVKEICILGCTIAHECVQNYTKEGGPLRNNDA